MRIAILTTSVLAVQRPHLSRHLHRAPAPIGELHSNLLRGEGIAKLPVLNGDKTKVLVSQTIPPKFINSETAVKFSLLEIPNLRSLHGLPAMADARHDAESMAESEISSTVDFPGNCHNFIPMAGLSTAKNLEECWDACRNFQFCTQVHFTRGNCFVAQGISQSLGQISRSEGTCRSLSDLGMLSFLKSRKSADLALPSFTQLPSEERFLLVQPKLESSMIRVITPSFFQCQSACLDRSWCRAAVWLDLAVSGESEKICMFGSSLIAESSETDSHEKCLNNICLRNICGDQTCLIAEKNSGDFGRVLTPLQMSEEAVSVEDKVCECMTEGCTNSCRREAEASCVSRCAGSADCKVAAVQKTFGKFSCFLSSAHPVSQNSQKIGFTVFARPEIKLISTSMSFSQHGKPALAENRKKKFPGFSHF